MLVLPAVRLDPGRSRGLRVDGDVKVAVSPMPSLTVVVIASDQGKSGL